jgi:glycerate 2-kinase
LITDKNINDILISIINSGIHAVEPEILMKEKIKYLNEVLYVNNTPFDLTNVKNVYVVGFGKVSSSMALELENILGNRISKGLIITNSLDESKLKIIKCKVGNHPIPDEKVLEASEEIISICKVASENDLVICLISGGGSSLFEKLPEKLNLQDLQKLTELLLASGASIHEINSVRKCFSLVKNGRLLSFIKPAKCISLIISDVVGDAIGSIASGPTYVDKTSFNKAYSILEFHGMIGKIPACYSDLLLDGIRKETQVEENNASTDSYVNNFIIGSNYEALLAAEKTAKQHQLNTMVISSKIQGEAREVAKVFGGIIEDIAGRDSPLKKPACIIAGGETTVTVRGHGLGGRNQELALAALLSLEDSKAKYAFASCGSDGIDGVTGCAGGIISHTMWETIKRNKIILKKYLDNNDSFHFLEEVGGLIYIQPNQTNVMDLIAGIIY